VIEVALLTTAGAETLPNLTAVTPTKLVPVMFTFTPTVPLLGEIEVTVGVAAATP
jgi:hypothetical protein